MTFNYRILPVARLSLGLLALGITGAVASAQSLNAHVAPGILNLGKNIGHEAPSTQLRLAVWLNLHNRSALDAKVKDLYAAGSPNFHKWLTNADLKEYAPTAGEVAAVKAELKAHNLAVTSVDPLNLSVQFEGRTSDVESAFRTQVNQYSVKGKMVRVTSSRPELSGTAAGLVQHLAGLNGMKGAPMLMHPKNMKTGLQYAGLPVAEAESKANGLYYADECFYAPSTVTLTGVNALDGVTPVSSTFTGLTYGADPTNTAKGTLAPCGYSPAQVEKFYGLDKAYAVGFDGAGQTVAIIDAYLQPTAKPDLVTFSKLYSLPAITSSNYAEYNPYGATMPGADFGTDEETDLDVQWVHSSAPGAKIALVQAFSDDEEDMQAAALFAVTSDLGNTISFSYGYPESLTGELASDIFDEIAEMAAAKGISIHASSGDSGDFGPASDFQLNGPDVSGWFADSPYATSVGGTSIGTAPDGSVTTTGWGNNIAFLSFDATDPYDPPQTEFYAGSGGGASSFFAKPAYQSGLFGNARLLPDVSALADPFTGAEFVYTDATKGGQYVGVVGGTSLAAPLFSGMWAITTQAAGSALGQAAPYVAAAPGYIIQDVLPVTGPLNTTGTVTDPMGTTTYTSTDLSQPLFNTANYVSALFDVGLGEYVSLTFGTDTTLTVTQGWDNVTGYGTPNLGPLLTALGAAKKQ